MIKNDNLFEKLPPKEESIDSIKDDLRNGLAPNLPFFILGIPEIKEKIKQRVAKMDSSFQISYITADYGNGKSNLMKYLEYFFELHPEYNIRVAYWRADMDKYDLILFLHYILQQNFSTEIKEAFKNIQKNNAPEFERLAHNYTGGYAVLEEYVQAISKAVDENDDEKLDRLIALGTGKIYDKRSFSKLGVNHFTDYNRREVLVFFLNALAHSGCYILFAIDEIEKIQEKSKVRFNSFLTSFRELIDLSSDIKGHYIMTAGTQASGTSSVMPLASYNPAFERRISEHVHALEHISSLEDIKELTRCLDDFMEANRSDEDIDTIVNFVKTRHYTNNNKIIQLICKKLVNQEFSTWRDKLEEFKLKDIFENTKKDIEEEDGFKGIHTKFFNSLKRYIDIVTYGDDDRFKIKAQGSQLLLEKELKKAHVFLFTGDYEANLNRIKNISYDFTDYQFVVYRPESLDISKAKLEDESIEVKNIITYDPENLMTLFAMYYLYFSEHEEDIKDIISIYTNGQL